MATNVRSKMEAATNVLSEMEASELCSAVYHWLSYETACHRTQTLYEAALRTPVASYLNTVIRINSASERETTVCEEDHPVLARLHAGRGDKPKVDVCVLTQGRRTTARWKLAIEMKWVPIGGKTSPVCALRADLHRLALIRRGNEGYPRLLLVAGCACRLKGYIADLKLPDGPKAEPLKLDADWAGTLGDSVAQQLSNLPTKFEVRYKGSWPELPIANPPCAPLVCAVWDVLRVKGASRSRRASPAATGAEAEPASLSLGGCEVEADGEANCAEPR